MPAENKLKLVSVKITEPIAAGTIAAFLRESTQLRPVIFSTKALMPPLYFINANKLPINKL